MYDLEDVGKLEHEMLKSPFSNTLRVLDERGKVYRIVLVEHEDDVTYLKIEEVVDSNVSGV